MIRENTHALLCRAVNERHFTQKSISDLSGVGPSTINMFLRTGENIGHKKMNALHNALVEMLQLNAASATQPDPVDDIRAMMSGLCETLAAMRSMPTEERIPVLKTTMIAINAAIAALDSKP